MSFTAQAVVNSCRQDLMLTVGADHLQFLDYVNRAQLQILRERNWKFMESDVQRFITSQGQTQYWIGANGGQAGSQVPTGLDITSKEYIMADSVRDVSSSRDLMETKHAPIVGGLRNPDGSFIYGRPRQWRNSSVIPGVFEIYPAPDAGNTYRPVPEAPFYTAAATGPPQIFTPTDTYYIAATFSNGPADTTGVTAPLTESAPSVPVLLTIPYEGTVSSPTLYQVTVYPPVPPLGPGTAIEPYTKWSLYVGGDTGSLNRISTNIPLTTSVIAGAVSSTNGTPSSTATIKPLSGYIINFKYYFSHRSIAALSDTCMIPSKYFDVMVSATNMFAALYLRDYAAGRAEDVAFWTNQYQNGIRTMTLDENSSPRQPDMIRPDRAASGNYMWYDFRSAF